MESQTEFSTKPLLRPDQLQTAKDEIKSLEAKLSNPLIEDKAMVMRQLRNAKRVTAEQTPHPPQSAEEEGRMVKRSKELLEKILRGMPSHEEMRKAPPGAVDKHLKWEGSNKPLIQEWKNLQLRLKPGEREAANLERHRPTGSTLNMDNAFIPGKQFFVPAVNGPVVTFTDEQIAYLKANRIEVGLMSNDQREIVKEHIGIGMEAQKNKGGRPRKVKQEAKE